MGKFLIWWFRTTFFLIQAFVQVNTEQKPAFWTKISVDSNILTNVLNQEVYWVPPLIILHIFQHLKGIQAKSKIFRINVSSDAFLDSFVTEVRAARIYEKLDNNLLSDPTQNYNIIEKKILETKEKLLTSKIVRFNKYRHKISPWITNGILVSIRHRDKLYYQKSQIPTTDANYHILESNLKIYNRVLNQAIRKAEIDYYQSMLKENEHDLKKTWSLFFVVIKRIKRILIESRLVLRSSQTPKTS